ncbi:hypothetical protein ACFZAM_31275 [Streptomyces sp. NPDC008079]|uniref:hypothetical protein n=1 Tax=Streptomyces sp. NPDC008079 TaxID=3364806 RepID=UPI0036F08531
MSLIWSYIGRMPPVTATWHDYSNPSGGYAQHAERLKKQVSDGHGIPGYAAGAGLRTLRDHLRADSDRASDYGFATGYEHSDSGSYPHELLNHKAWHRMEPEKVSLRQPIHASQYEMDANSVAHNIFHPGKPHPADWDEIGNPDHDPTQDSMPVPTHVRTDLPRLYRNEQGQMHVVDGHHRLAADMLLKKSHTQALVWDAKNPPTRPTQLPLF